MEENWKNFEIKHDVRALRERIGLTGIRGSESRDIFDELGDAMEFVRPYSETGMIKHLKEVEIPLLYHPTPDGFFFDIQLCWLRGFDILPAIAMLIKVLEQPSRPATAQAVIDHLSYIAYLFGNGSEIAALLKGTSFTLLPLENINFSVYEKGNLFESVTKLITNARKAIEALTKTLDIMRKPRQ